MKTKYFSILLLLLVAGSVWAEETIVPTYTLQQCRQMAMDASHNTEMRQESMEAARLNQQAALAAMFPKLSVNASYMWNSKSPAILGNELQTSFGTARVGADGTGSFEWSETSLINQLSQGTRTLPDAHARVGALGAEVGGMIANAYQELYRALHPDLTHVVVGQVGLTQPIYVGGRLKALHDIATTAKNVAEIEADSKQKELIVSVDEAYWRVGNVEHKKKLANQYYDLLVTLEGNVTELVNEGLATKSDLLKVKAKRGEAEVKKMQADNGLVLSKMALCQIIGLPLQTEFVLDDQGLEDIQLHDTLTITDDLSNARSEVQLLDQA